MKKMLSVAGALVSAAALSTALAATANAQTAPNGYAPLTIRNVVQPTDQLLGGGSFEGQSCTKVSADVNWVCSDLNSYGWFRDGLAGSGTTGDGFTNNINITGSFEDPINHCVAIKPTAIANGYLGSLDPLLLCKGPGGWTATNAANVNLVVTFTDGSTVSAANAHQAGWQYTITDSNAVEWDHLNTSIGSATLHANTPASQNAQPKGPVNAQSPNAGMKPKTNAPNSNANTNAIKK